MSQALSNQTTSGTAVTSGSQAGFSVDVGRLVRRAIRSSSLIPMRRTISTPSPLSRWAPAARCRRNRPMQTIRSIGVNFAAGMGSVVSQLNAALGTNLQFSNPSGTVLQVLNNGAGNVVNSLSATSTVTRLPSGSAQLPLFTDGRPADHRRDYRRAARRPRVLPAASGQSGARRFAIEPGRLCGKYRLRRSDAAEFHPQSDDQRGADLFADNRPRHRTTPYSGTLSQYMSHSQASSRRPRTPRRICSRVRIRSLPPCSSGSTTNRVSISTPKCPT